MHSENIRRQYERFYHSCKPKFQCFVKSGWNYFDLFLQIDSCSRFWFQPEIESVKVQEFQDYLKNYRKTVLRSLPKNDGIQVGRSLIVALSGCSDFKYHRAKIVAVADQQDRYKVKLIDFGEVIDCSEKQFFEYCGSSRKFIDLPPRCFECGLAEVQPSQLRYPDGLWPNAANDLIKFETNQRLIEIVVSCSIHTETGNIVFDSHQNTICR